MFKNKNSDLCVDSSNFLSLTIIHIYRQIILKRENMMETIQNEKLITKRINEDKPH